MAHILLVNDHVRASKAKRFYILFIHFMISTIYYSNMYIMYVICICNYDMYRNSLLVYLLVI